MNSEIAVFMAMKKVHGIFMKKRFVVRGVPIELRVKSGAAKL